MNSPGIARSIAFGWGDLLILAGMASFLVYTIGGAGLPGFSPLRYTAVTATLGWVSIAGATLVADVAGLEHVPAAAQVAHALPALGYLVLLAVD